MGMMGHFAGQLLDAMEDRFKTEITPSEFTDIYRNFLRDHMHRNMT